MNTGALLDAGLLADPSALAELSELRDERGARVLRLRLLDGWQLDVLPDRGLDLGAAWFAGRPVAWRSPIPADPGPGHGWDRRFLGGLLVTCGPDFIGPGTLPDGRAGLHGSHSATPAVDVRWHRRRVGDELELVVEGAVEDVRMLGRRIRVERSIAVRTGSNAIRVRDVVRNLGLAAEPVALLHHVNLGAPAVLPGAMVDVEAERWVAREATASVPHPFLLPEPIDVAEETVFQHEGLREGVATATSPDGVATSIRWDLAAQPHLVQWVLPTRGGWALGLEPSTAPLFGEGAGTRLLAPGGSFATSLEIEHHPAS